MRERWGILDPVLRWTPLASSWAKFHRAGTHLDGLNDELARINGDSESVGVDMEGKADEVFLRLTSLPYLREVGLLIGDTVNNYRAALDHLAWDLVKLGADPKPKRPDKIYYPLARSWESLRARRREWLPGVGDDAFRIIRLHQPYRRDRRGFLLRTLRDISDIDKHRYFVPAAHSMTGFVGRTTLHDCTLTRDWRCSPRRALYVGMKVYRVWISAVGPVPNVEIESQMSVEPCLSRGVAIMDTMTGIRSEVLLILSAFEERIG